jgi:DNA-3-methyladenine glycosylase I
MGLSLKAHPDGAHRCSWCGEGDGFSDYIQYHDNEWGLPTLDEQRLFEKICLEGFQAGLSWITVLRKRDRFRAVFADFDIRKVAKFSTTDVDRLMQDPGIIRHRGKIVSTINNAQRVATLLDEQGPGALAKLLWSFEPKDVNRPTILTAPVLVTLTQSEESVAMSKALKKRGFSFVGATTMYAMMQSMGMVNDHIQGCHSRLAVEAARRRLKRP